MFEWISVQNIVILNHSKPLLFICNKFAVDAIKKNVMKQNVMIPKKNVAIYLIVFIVNVKWLDNFRIEPVQNKTVIVKETMCGMEMMKLVSQSFDYAFHSSIFLTL